MIIGITSKIGGGKDTVAKTIQALDCWYNQYGKNLIKYEGYTDIKFAKEMILKNEEITQTSWSNKKFATKLKQVLALIFDVDEKQFEDINFKNSLIPENLQPEKNGNKTYRDALTYIGTECLQKWDKNIWVKCLFNQYKPICDEYPKGNYMKICSICRTKIFDCQISCNLCQDCWEIHKYPNWVISDVRFIHEINSVRQHNGYLIRIDRIQKDSTLNHSSEFEWQEYKDWDFIIDNNGDYENLIRQVKDIMFKLELIRL